MCGDSETIEYTVILLSKLMAGAMRAMGEGVTPRVMAMRRILGLEMLRPPLVFPEAGVEMERKHLPEGTCKQGSKEFIHYISYIMERKHKQDFPIFFPGER